MATGTDLGLDLHDTSLFFDRLVELIPPNFYFPTDPVDSDKWKFKHSKTARAVAKQTAKENSKKAKRARLDPDNFKSSLDVQRERAAKEDAANTNNGTEGDGEGTMKKPGLTGHGRLGQSVSYEELQLRLQRRLLQLRGQRNADATAEAVLRAKEWRKKKAEASQAKVMEKRAAAVAAKQGKTVPAGPVHGAKGAGSGGAEARQDNGAAKQPGPSQRSEEPRGSVQYSALELPGDSDSRGKKRKKTSKEELLVKAQALQEELKAAAKSADPAAKGLLQRHAWGSALSRATGEKVKDDPTLLKKSIKRGQQQRERSAKKWTERKGREEEAHTAKKKKRDENIQHRKDVKKEHAIAKREKKLMKSSSSKAVRAEPRSDT